MTKPNLPVVTLDTIKEVGIEAITGSDVMFRVMAAANPELYRFIYDVYNLPETSKMTMLSMAVAMYHVLERELEKGKRSKKRLRHNGS